MFLYYLYSCMLILKEDPERTSFLRSGKDYFPSIQSKVQPTCLSFYPHQNLLVVGFVSFTIFMYMTTRDCVKSRSCSGNRADPELEKYIDKWEAAQCRQYRDCGVSFNDNTWATIVLDIGKYLYQCCLYVMPSSTGWISPTHGKNMELDRWLVCRHAWWHALWWCWMVLQSRLEALDHSQYVHLSRCTLW